MKAVWIIAKRELQAFFDSLIAYIMLILFLGFSGFFTWLSGSDVFFSGQASLRPFFSIAYWTLFFFIPALTMRLLAEEKRSGTIELLLTKAISDRQVIRGKYLATLLLIGIALLFTLPYVITVAGLGNMDLGATLCGYLGLFFMSSAYIAIGLFASSLSQNQIVSFLFALLMGLFFHLLFDMLAATTTGGLGRLLDNLSMATHFDSISRGVIDLRDLFFFFSLTAGGLVLSEFSLAKRNVIR